jgi:hypothetical protein
MKATGKIAACLVAVGGFVAACRTAGPPIPKWTSTVLDYGQGQLRLGIRPRSVADLDELGATILTPEGGKAFMRVFVCARSRQAVQALIRLKLRDHLVKGQFFDDERTFGWRWLKGGTIRGQKMNSAVSPFGPLLIAVTSANLPLDEVIELARRVRLEPPVPMIRGCFPLCGVADRECQLQTQGDEGISPLEDD